MFYIASLYGLFESFHYFKNLLNNKNVWPNSALSEQLCHTLCSRICLRWWNWQNNNEDIGQIHRNGHIQVMLYLCSKICVQCVQQTVNISISHISFIQFSFIWSESAGSTTVYAAVDGSIVFNPAVHSTPDKRISVSFCVHTFCDILIWCLCLFLTLQVFSQVSFQCDECGKFYVQKSVLLDHIRLVHNKAPRYSCNVCNRGFMSKTLLQSHEMSHLKVWHADDIHWYVYENNISFLKTVSNCILLFFKLYFIISAQEFWMWTLWQAIQIQTRSSGAPNKSSCLW